MPFLPEHIIKIIKIIVMKKLKILILFAFLSLPGLIISVSNAASDYDFFIQDVKFERNDLPIGISQDVTVTFSVNCPANTCPEDVFAMVKVNGTGLSPDSSESNSYGFKNYNYKITPAENFLKTETAVFKLKPGSYKISVEGFNREVDKTNNSKIITIPSGNSTDVPGFYDFELSEVKITSGADKPYQVLVYHYSIYNRGDSQSKINLTTKVYYDSVLWDTKTFEASGLLLQKNVKFDGMGTIHSGYTGPGEHNITIELSTDGIENKADNNKSSLDFTIKSESVNVTNVTTIGVDVSIGYASERLDTTKVEYKNGQLYNYYQKFVGFTGPSNSLKGLMKITDLNTGEIVQETEGTNPDTMGKNSGIISYGWTPKRDGLYEVKFILDPFNQIAEANEDDNAYAMIITVGKSTNTDIKPDIKNESNPVANKPNQINEIINIAKLLKNDEFAKILLELKQLRDLVREQQTEIKYLKGLRQDLKKLSAEVEGVIKNFITYGVDENTKKLGEGERAAVINSFKAAFGKLPETEEELADAIKIANGRFPSILSASAEKKAKNQFVKIYKRVADMSDAKDAAAIKVMAYGLKQKAENRNLNSEKAGIKIFKAIFKKTPASTEEWNAMQAITYSGATQKKDSDNDLIADETETKLGTDPKKSDTDGDGFKDGNEVLDGYNPNGSGKATE